MVWLLKEIRGPLSAAGIAENISAVQAEELLCILAEVSGQASLL